MVPGWLRSCVAGRSVPANGRKGAWRTRGSRSPVAARWDSRTIASRMPWRCLGGAAPPRPLDAQVAAAGIEEFLTEFLPGLLAQPEVSGLTGSLHLHATDGPSEWWVDLGAGADAAAVPGHAKADTAVRGTESDLLLWLTNRSRVPAVEILGRDDVAASWTQLRR
jgi:MDMPI C-terminal domain